MDDRGTRNGRKAAGHEERRARRHDPQRRERILDAALDVLVADGVAGLTHRKVASRADAPLGSVTYHFASLADLRAQAFAWYVEQRSAEYEALFTEVATRGPGRCLGGHVEGGPSRHRSAVLGFELHLAALRDPALRALTQEWTRASRAVLARFTGPETAARLDALLEGMIMHALLSADRERVGSAGGHRADPRPGHRVGDMNARADGPCSHETAMAVRSTYLVFAALGLAGATWVSRLPQIRERMDLDAASVGLLLLLIAVACDGAASGRNRRHTSRAAADCQCGGRARRHRSRRGGARLRLVAAPALHRALPAGHGHGLLGRRGDRARRSRRTAARPVLMSRFFAGFSLGTVTGACLGALMSALHVPVGLHIGAVAIIVTLLTPWAARSFLSSPAPRHGRRG